MAVYRHGTAVPEITRRGSTVAEIYRADRLVYQRIESRISLTPRFVRMNPDGEEFRVTVDSNTPWTIPASEYRWQDGSGDALTVEYSGNRGTGDITLRTSANTTGLREIEIPVLTERGKVFGHLKVSQSDLWTTYAYNAAYSNGYPAATAETTLEVVPEKLHLERSPGGSSQMEVTTSQALNWNIQINYQ